MPPDHLSESTKQLIHQTLPPCRSPSSSGTGIHIFDLGHLESGIGNDDELGDPVATGYLIRIVSRPRVVEDHSNDIVVSSIIRIEYSWGIEDDHAMFQGESRSGTHETNISFGDCDAQPDLEQMGLTRLQLEVLIRREVDSCRTLGCERGDRNVR